MATQNNQGEGNQTAARQYNDAQKRFAESGKVEPAAKDAAKALNGALKAVRSARPRRSASGTRMAKTRR
jgi:hypothetical protein